MTVHFHEEDLPAGVFAPGARRRRYRDDGADHAARPAVPRPDLGRRRRRASRPLRARQRLCRAQSARGARRSGAGEALSFRALRSRRDQALSRRHRRAGLLHQDRVAADAHLYRPAWAEGAGPRTARPGYLQAAAIVRLGRPGAVSDAQKDYAASDVRYPPRAARGARRAAGARRAGRARPGLFRFPAARAPSSISPAGRRSTSSRMSEAVADRPDRSRAASGRAPAAATTGSSAALRIAAAGRRSASSPRSWRSRR